MLAKIQLRFQGGDEIIIFKLNRRTKTLFVSSSLTSYQDIKLPWKRLFDSRKESFQEKVTDKLNDEEFILSIVQQMRNWGYRRVEQSIGQE